MKKQESKEQAITVAGITFTAEQVKSAVITVQGRDVHIGEPETKKQKTGFNVE